MSIVDRLVGTFATIFAPFLAKTNRIFDLETDGLLAEVTQVHVLVIHEVETETTKVFRRNDREDTIAEGLALLADPDTMVWAHNGTNYDCQVLYKLFGLNIPWWRSRDTMLLGKLVWPELKFQDITMRAERARRGEDFPGQLIGRHSLEAWGWRLREHKGEYKGDPELVEALCGGSGFCTEEELAAAKKEAYRRRWESWNQAMEDYCVQDVVVTTKLRERILAKTIPAGGDWPLEVFALESQVWHIICRQEAHGFLFDSRKAHALHVKLLARKLEIERELAITFAPRFLRDGADMVPKRDNKTMGYVEGAPLTKIKLTDFNPGSRDHVATWLMRDFGWEPTAFGSDGKPTVDDDVVSALPYPEAKPLKEYFMVVKRLGQLAEGNEAWLRHVKANGRIHGRVDSVGTITYRMTHQKPNTGQVPGGKSPYGHECRELFCVPPGKLLVGADADALELRDLAGYMAIFDGGDYIRTVLEGKKENGTDMHSVNCRALAMDPKEKFFDGESGRDIAKTWFYAFIYGAGDEQLGWIVLRKRGNSARSRGKKDRAAFLANLPAMGELVKQVKARAKERGFLVGIDGRPLVVRSDHAALNTLLQACGAIQMKVALCILDDSLQALGLIPGVHYEFVANVHDEWQIEVDEQHATTVGEHARRAIQDAGRALGFRCPLDGAFEVGATWADTH